MTRRSWTTLGKGFRGGGEPLAFEGPPTEGGPAGGRGAKEGAVGGRKANRRAGGGLGKIDRRGLEEAFRFDEGNLEEFMEDGSVDVPSAVCQGGWIEEQVVLLLAAVYGYQKKVVFSIVRVGDLCG
jgi:hypothetical protein